MVLQYILQQFCMPQNNPLPVVRSLNQAVIAVSETSMMVCDVDAAFLESCKTAEERQMEMKCWKSTLAKRDTSLSSDRLYLYEIRGLAIRKY